ncbi:MAG: shikimate dehydrogenase [Dermatophilaceae bacterium]
MVLGEPGLVLTTATRRAAVLGSPISHSLSPALHSAAYRALGLTNWSYGAHEVRSPALPAFVTGLGAEWAGLSLTMPLKEAAFEVADEVSDLARQVGAINTLVRTPDGGWRGENTDVYGISQALREAGCTHVTSSIVLGSGATARSVVAALAMLGCQRVTFAVRSAARPETLDRARRAGLEVDVVGLADFADGVGDAPVVVSTLPADAPADRMLPEGSRLQGHFLLDVVYADWPTPLARVFEEAGASVVSGFEMLVHQGAAQVHLMTGLVAPVEPMRVAGLAAMAARRAMAARDAMELP